MQKYIFSFLLLSCFIYISSADDHGENAVTYTKETFDEAINKQEVLFVMFYAPWCGHCKRLAPTWDDLAKEYNVENRQLTIGKVDCTKETGLCGEHFVRGYPTVKWFHGNNIGIKYGNKRTIEDLRAFVEEALAKGEDLNNLPKEGKPAERADEKKEEKVEEKEPVVVVTEGGLYDLSDATFESHVAQGHHFIKFYAPWCGHCKRLAPTWEQLASATQGNDKVKIGKVDCTQHQKTCTKFGIRGYPTLLWFTNGEKSEDYRGQRTLDELSKFVTKMSSVESETAKTSKDGKVPDVLKDEPEAGVVDLDEEDFKDSVAEDFTLAVFDNDQNRMEAVLPTLEKLAERYVEKPEMLVATVDCNKNAITCKNQDANGPYPIYKLYHNGAAIRTYSGEKTVVAMETFINDMMKGYGKERDEL